MSSSADPVALLGLGAMGSRLGARLLDAGLPLRVWNRTPAAAEALAAQGAVVAGTPAEAVRDAAVVLVCVRDDAASAEVWEQLSPELAPAAVAVELSTVTPGHIRGLADKLGERFLEAPMVGSRPQVEGGQLQLLVGGTAATLERARPVLDAVAGGLHHVGGPGDAAVLKLVVNGMLASQLAVVGELLGVVRRAGLDEGAAAELLAALPVTSPAIARSFPRIIARQTAPAFPIALAAKDLGYLLGEADGAPVLERVADALRGRVEDGLGDEDVVALAQPRG